MAICCKTHYFKLELQALFFNGEPLTKPDSIWLTAHTTAPPERDIVDSSLFEESAIAPLLLNLSITDNSAISNAVEIISSDGLSRNIIFFVLWQCKDEQYEGLYLLKKEAEDWNITSDKTLTTKIILKEAEKPRALTFALFNFLFDSSNTFDFGDSFVMTSHFLTQYEEAAADLNRNFYRSINTTTIEYIDTVPSEIFNQTQYQAMDAVLLAKSLDRNIATFTNNTNFNSVSTDRTAPQKVIHNIWAYNAQTAQPLLFLASTTLYTWYESFDSTTLLPFTYSEFGVCNDTFTIPFVEVNIAHSSRLVLEFVTAEYIFID